MSALSALMLLALGAVFQAVLPTPAWMGQVRPPVLLGQVVYYALTRKTGAVLAVALGAGLLQDALGPIPLGYSSLCFCLVALLLRRHQEEVFSRTAFTHLVFGGLAAGSVTAGLFAMLRATGALELSVPQALLKVAGSMALGAALTPLLFRAMDRVDLLAGNVEDRSYD